MQQHKKVQMQMPIVPDPPVAWEKRRDRKEGLGRQAAWWTNG